MRSSSTTEELDCSAPIGAHLGDLADRRAGVAELDACRPRSRRRRRRPSAARARARSPASAIASSPSRSDQLVQLVRPRVERRPRGSRARTSSTGTVSSTLRVGDVLGLGAEPALLGEVSCLHLAPPPRPRVPRAGTSRSRAAPASAGRAARRCAGSACGRTSRPGGGPRRRDRSSSTGCALRATLCTHSTTSSACLRTWAKILWFDVRQRLVAAQAEHGVLLAQRDEPPQPAQQRRRRAQLGLDVHGLVAVDRVHQRRRVELREVGAAEAAVAVAGPLHRRAHAVAVAEVDVVAHARSRRRSRGSASPAG